MSKIIPILIVVLLLASCYHDAPDPSFDKDLIIPADSMVSILADLHIADGIISSKKGGKNTPKQLSTEYFEEIMKRHHIEKKRFEESMRYYSYHTETLIQIYDKVIMELNKKESMLIPAKDSLKISK